MKRPGMPAAIAVLYLLLGTVWIFVTDRLLITLDTEPTRNLQLQMYKGWLFVFASALLLYLLLRRYQRRCDSSLTKLLASQEEVQRMNAELERRVLERTRQMEAINRELESFAYAVSHDLRAPLRSMSGFSQILRESAPESLDEKSLHYLQRIHDASQRMSALIDDLLSLSRISRSELSPRPVDLSLLASEAATTIADRYQGRNVELHIAPSMSVYGDPRLLRIALDNLLDNAWKYTSRAKQARVEVGTRTEGDETIYFVRDNGVGFDMTYADKLFGPFQRLHADADFPGTGIGLVTVQRILTRHGGRIWVEAAPERGATFFFTLPPSAATTL